MNKIIVSLIFVSLIFSPIFSSVAAAGPDIDALKQEQATLLDAMNTLESEFDLNEAKAPRLDQRSSDLEWSAKMVGKEIDKWNAESATLTIKTDNYSADVGAHNSRCDRTVDTQSEFDQCNRSKAALDSRKATLDGEIQYINGQRDTVQGLITNQTVQENALQREIDAYNAHRQELAEAGNRIQKRLDEIQPYIDSCNNAIASGNIEAMKDQCGRMFDGN